MKKFFCLVLSIVMLVCCTAVVPYEKTYAKGIEGDEDKIDAPIIESDHTYKIDYNGNRNADLYVPDTYKTYYFKYEITKAGDYYFSFKTLTDDSIDVKLYDSDYKYKTGDYNLKGSYNSAVYLDEGEYYVGVYLRSTDQAAQFSLDKMAKPGKVTGVKLSYYTNWLGMNKGISIDWNVQSKVTGYQVRYATNSKMKNAKKYYTSGPDEKYLVCTNNKTYYIQVRAYNEQSDGKKLYGSWSTIRKKKYVNN